MITTIIISATVVLLVFTYTAYRLACWKAYACFLEGQLEVWTDKRTKPQTSLGVKQDGTFGQVESCCGVAMEAPLVDQEKVRNYLNTHGLPEE